MTDPKKLRRWFKDWANKNGYDVAEAHDGELTRFLNPMTRDLWYAYVAGDAAKEIAEIGRNTQ